MAYDEKEVTLEKSRLKNVLEEIGRQLEVKEGSAEKFRSDLIRTNRLMWEDLTLAPQGTTDLEDVAQASQYMDEIKRQAIKRNFYGRQVVKLRKMYGSPYFGRMDFLEDGMSGAEQIYIGISNLVEEKNGEYLVYDWRAPVSSMFYDYETGRAAYLCPEGRIEGELGLKRQYRISNGQMEYMFDSGLRINDEILQEILGRSADSRMKTIITSIQQEQNRIIRDDAHKVLIVHGPAGSGKTSVALHRVAYLLYKHRDTVSAENILIFSPNQIFNDYISNVLPELGEENMYQTTFMDYTRKALGENTAREDMNRQMEYLISKRGQPQYGDRAAGIRCKASNAFVRVLEAYVAYLQEDGFRFEDIVYREQTVISGEALKELYQSDYKYLPVAKRLEKIKQRIFYLLAPYEKERAGQVEEELANSGEYIDRTEIKARSLYKVREEFREVKEAAERMTHFDPLELYRKLFEDAGLLGRITGAGAAAEEIGNIRASTLKQLAAGNAGYEDAIPVLYLKGAMGGLPNTSGIKHVVIDEAQDYSPLQYAVIKQLFPDCSLTILGDLNQSINPFYNIGSLENLLELFRDSNAAMVRLSKSYRSTREITGFARGLLKDSEGSEIMDRSGEKPELIGLQDDREMYRKIAGDIEVFREKGYKSMAVICKTSEKCAQAFGTIGKNTGARLVTDSDEEYATGIVVIPSYLAKGLEFDAVLVCGAGEQDYPTEEERRLFYTICTRALHRLNIYYTGQMCEFIKELDESLYIKR